jgi:hypothetical protein
MDVVTLVNTARKFAIPILYFAVTAALALLLDRYLTRYLQPMTSPIFDSRTPYMLAVPIWFAAACLHWVPRVGFLIFAAVSAFWLGNCYFALNLRLYFWSSHEVVLFLGPVLGINLLFVINRTPLIRLLTYNAVLFFATMPLAWQYAIIAARPVTP